MLLEFLKVGKYFSLKIENFPPFILYHVGSRWTGWPSMHCEEKARKEIEILGKTPHKRLDQKSCLFSCFWTNLWKTFEKFMKISENFGFCNWVYWSNYWKFPIFEVSATHYEATRFCPTNFNFLTPESHPRNCTYCWSKLLLSPTSI